MESPNHLKTKESTVPTKKVTEKESNDLLGEDVPLEGFDPNMELTDEEWEQSANEQEPYVLSADEIREAWEKLRDIDEWPSVRACSSSEKLVHTRFCLLL